MSPNSANKYQTFTYIIYACNYGLHCAHTFEWIESYKLCTPVNVKWAGLWVFIIFDHDQQITNPFHQYHNGNSLPILIRFNWKIQRISDLLIEWIFERWMLKQNPVLLTYVKYTRVNQTGRKSEIQFDLFMSGHLTLLTNVCKHPSTNSVN